MLAKIILFQYKMLFLEVQKRKQQKENSKKYYDE